MKLEQLNSDDMFRLSLYKTMHESSGAGGKIKALAEAAGRYMECYAVGVFEYSEAGDYMKLAHGWFKDKSVADLADRIQISEVAWVGLTNDSNTLISENIEALPDFIRDVFLFRGIKSIAMLKCFDGEKFLGAVCFAEGGSKRKWTEAEIALLHFLGELISPLLALKGSEGANESYGDMALGIINNLGSGIFVSDLETYEVLFVNESLRQMWELSPAHEIVGKKCWEVFAGNQRGPCASCPVKVVKQKYGLIPGKIVKGEIINPVNGQWFYCENSFFPWSDGRLVHMECISEYYDSKRLEEGWENYASVDEQTGVYSREWGVRILDTERIRAKNAGIPLSVCFMKLEGINELREALGDISAQSTINSVLESIKSNIRVSDIVFKWEADMFLVLFKKCGLSYSRAVLNKINNSMVELSGQKGFPLSLNVGLQEISGDNNFSAEEIVSILGKKMYADRFNKMKEKNRRQLPEEGEFAL